MNLCVFSIIISMHKIHVFDQQVLSSVCNNTMMLILNEDEANTKQTKLAEIFTAFATEDKLTITTVETLYLVVFSRITFLEGNFPTTITSREAFKNTKL